MVSMADSRRSTSSQGRLILVWQLDGSTETVG